MAEKDRRPPFDDFDARMRRLRGEPAADAETAERQGGDRRSGAWAGVHAGIEIFVAFVVGLGVGWGLDTWLGTMPLFLILFVLLGGAAGVLNAYRTLRRMGMIDEDGSGPGAKP
jgi:ATP synthase protein I